MWLLYTLACAPKVVLPETPSETAGLEAHTEADGLRWNTLRAGRGRTLQKGDFARVAYVGWVQGQGLFDANGDGFVFPVGAGQVIAGWDEGVVGMSVGERRQLIIPPTLGYGSDGVKGVIPPGATLIFEVELLGVED